MKNPVRYSLLGLLGVAAYLFWAIPYRGMLNYHEEFQLFQSGTDYFLRHLSQRGGLCLYVSEFIVQFYNNYWIGALLLALELLLIQWLTWRILAVVFREWCGRHGYGRFFLSLLPMLGVWLVLGDINVKHSLVMAVIIALALLYGAVRITKKKTFRVAGTALAVLLYLWAAGTDHRRVSYLSFSFNNIYHSKTVELLDYDLLVRTGNWPEIIRRAEAQQPDLPQSVCSTNLALGMTNQMGDRALRFYQNGTEGLFPSFAKDHFSTLTTAEVYFHLGLVNTAQRFYFEAMEASPDHRKSCRCIRRLAETNLINGRYDVARKYLHLLERTSIYRQWARRTLDLIDGGDAAVGQHPLYGRMRQMSLDEDFLFSDKEIDKICGRLLVHNHDNVLALQYMLLYPLLEKNQEKFVQYMYLVRDEVPYSMELASYQKYLR